jgi:hypothetical protein
MPKNNKASLMFFEVDIDVCFEVLVSEKSTSSSKPVVFIC